MNQISFKFNSQNLKAILPDEAAQSVWAEIFKEREYKIAEEVIKQATDPIIDVGAHVGLFVIYARALNKQVPILAIEPESNNFELLNKNIKDNKLSKVKTFQIALGDQSEETKLFIAPDSHNHSLVENYLANISDMGKDKNNNQIIKVQTLRDFLDQQKIRQVSLIKMDIEGGEYAVFESLNANDFTKIKNFVMEYHNFKDKNHKKLEAQLRENGFGVQVFPSRFDKTMGFIFANNKRI